MIIDISYGSGGKSTSELIENIFYKHFRNEHLEKSEDAAVLNVNGKIAFSTDSFVVTPLFFKGGDIGKLAVCGTVNDLLMMGATPQYLSASFIIETGLDTQDLEKIAISMKEAAKEANVQIVTGDTKVIEGKGGVYINTSGIGLIADNVNIGAKNCQSGDCIIVSGSLGEHHACILSSRMGIENSICSDCAPLNGGVDALLKNTRVKAMRDITRGGLGTILNELAKSSDVLAKIYEEKIPINNEVKGFCELLGLDPLYMGNEGKFLAVVDKKDAKKAIELLKSSPYCRDACIIGYFEEGKGVVLSTRLGGERMIDVLYGEGLPRIC